ncbi:MAG: ABC transporter permease [Acidobacteriota bacterium]
MTPKAIRTAWRFLSRRPSLVAVATLTLALGIGANTAMFSIVRAVLLNPLPFAEPHRLVAVWPEGNMPRGDYLLFEERSTSYASLAGFTGAYRASLTGDGEPLRIDTAAVTSTFFTTLGSPPQLGSTFTADASDPGRDAVIVIGDELFRTRYGGDPSLIGRTLTLDGVDRTVIGVASPDLKFPSQGVQAWIPAVLDPGDWDLLWTRGYLSTIGRLAPGVEVGAANRELEALMPALRDAFPWDMPTAWGAEAQVVSLREAVVGDVKPALRLLFAAVALVLLIACVNVANLLLAHNRGRAKEMALRSALGGGRSDLLGQVLAESLALATLGGVAGLAVGWISLQLLRRNLPSDMPRLAEISLDGGVLAFTGIAAVAAGLIMGVLPALRASNPNLNKVLRDLSAGSGTGRDHRRTASLLVVAQVTATLVLVIGAGLLIRSFAAQLQEPTGLEIRGVLTAAIAPPEARFDSSEALNLFYDDLVEKLAALPGVTGAAVSNQIPFDPAFYGTVFLLEGQPEPTGGVDWPMASGRFIVSPEFFETLGLELEQGRFFDQTDRADAQPVVIISKSLASKYWPGEDDVVGKRIAFPGDRETQRRIVGVVGNVKLRQLTDSAPTALYQPMAQSPQSSVFAVLRTGAEPGAYVDDVRRTVAGLDANTPVSQIRPFEEIVATSLDQPRFTMSLLGTFATLALALAMVGLYGILSYSVAQRQQELAVRMSLGAEPARLQRLVVRQGLWLVGLGLAFGLPAAYGASKLLQSQLFGVGTVDPKTYLGAVAVLTCSALLSTWLPALRASRVDPMALLRSE